MFQSYNLISHQSVLQNVELALTISGISKAERRRRAKEALEKVGLGDQLHKKPNQMSGGQMQRVAIARALVNNPEILLADEPTGALDSQTGIQVMELLKEVAHDRLVIMVTHNPELANAYATRIVNLRDGKIVDDSNPPDSQEAAAGKAEKPKKASMSRRTSLGLSFNDWHSHYRAAHSANQRTHSYGGGIGRCERDPSMELRTDSDNHQHCDNGSFRSCTRPFRSEKGSGSCLEDRIKLIEALRA